MYSYWMHIGSLVWRLRNYGVLPAVNYLIDRGHQFKPIVFNKDETLCFTDFFYTLISFTDTHINKSSFDEILTAISRELQSSANSKPGNYKRDQLTGKQIPIRLRVVSLILAIFQPDTLIETGTQHGISSYFSGQISEHFNLNTRIETFDVCTHDLILRSPSVNYNILKRPTRRNFCLKTEGLNKVVFFHDSDHSRENMLFEFNWAWHNLECSVLISDDISGNNAFFEFCTKYHLPYFTVYEPGEPLIGVVLRNYTVPRSLSH